MVYTKDHTSWCRMREIFLETKFANRDILGQSCLHLQVNWKSHCNSSNVLNIPLSASKMDSSWFKTHCGVCTIDCVEAQIMFMALFVLEEIKGWRDNVSEKPEQVCSFCTFLTLNRRPINRLRAGAKSYLSSLWMNRAVVGWHHCDIIESDKTI